MALYFDERGLFNQRALVHIGIKAIAHFGGLDFGGKLLDKLLVHPALHINAVRANAGLAGVAVFAGKRTFDGAVNVGIIKDQKRRVAAQLEREFLDRWRALRHQNTPHFGGAGKAQMAYHGAGANHFAHRHRIVGIGRHHIENAGGNACTHGQHGSCQRSQRR